MNPIPRKLRTLNRTIYHIKEYIVNNSNQTMKITCSSELVCIGNQLLHMKITSWLEHVSSLRLRHMSCHLSGWNKCHLPASLVFSFPTNIISFIGIFLLFMLGKDLYFIRVHQLIN